MPRNATYDYARLIAAFGIVLFHARAPGGQIGYAALPFFLMLMITMALPAAQTQGFGPYARSRSQRLLRPWLIWSVIYGGLKLAEVALTQATLGGEFAPHMLLTGPAIHLWFLPFALLACLAIHPVVRATQVMPRSILALGLLAAALALHSTRQDHVFDVPVAQWMYVAPVACLGLGMALLRGSHGMDVVLAAGFVILSAAFGWTQGLLQLGLAAAALVACGLVHLPRTRASDIAASSAMGVYLAHPLVFSVLERITPMAKSSLLFAVLAGLCAWALALVLPRLGAATGLRLA